MENIEQLIIEKAKQLIKQDFMQYPEFDESLEFTIKDAITFLITNQMGDIESSLVYDFVISKLK